MTWTLIKGATGCVVTIRGATNNCGVESKSYMEVFEGLIWISKYKKSFIMRNKFINLM